MVYIFLLFLISFLMKQHIFKKNLIHFFLRKFGFADFIFNVQKIFDFFYWLKSEAKFFLRCRPKHRPVYFFYFRINSPQQQERRWWFKRRYAFVSLEPGTLILVGFRARNLNLARFRARNFILGWFIASNFNLGRFTAKNFKLGWFRARKFNLGRFWDMNFKLGRYWVRIETFMFFTRIENYQISIKKN